MPRLSNSLRLRAYHIDRLLPLLLRVTRDLASARNELRWLGEHVNTLYPKIQSFEARHELIRLCRQRGRGRPLQYILGSEYFGELEIKCRDGIFIPRQETAAAVDFLIAKLDNAGMRNVRVLDVCSGTGAMSLLLAHLMQTKQSMKSLDILGIDVSRSAVELARQNASRLFPHTHNIRIEYVLSDLFQASPAEKTDFDIILCNPPYISEKGLWRDTARSVRMYEPRAALVPLLDQGRGIDRPEDAFYHKVIQDFKAKVVLFEVAHLEQAYRVAKTALDRGWKCEIWRDWPRGEDGLYRFEDGSVNKKGQEIEVKGIGEGRSVFLWRHA